LTHLETTFSIDEDQQLIISFLNDVSKKELELKKLLKENEQLRATLEKNSDLNDLKEHNFLHGLVNNILKKSHSKSKFGYRYNNYIKDVAVYLFMLGGRQTYELLRDNLGLPSCETVLNEMSKVEEIEEGVLQINLAKQVMDKKKLPPYVFLSEDDTRIIKRLRYNSKSDVVMGLEIPVDENGIPYKNFFKFTSIKTVLEYVDKYPMCKNLKLVCLTFIDPRKQVMILMLTGVSKNDQSSIVEKRWKNINDMLKSVGIKVVGWSADGAPEFTRTMQITSAIPNIHKSECPEEFRWFFDGKWNPEFIVFQDFVHLAVKFWRRLMNKNLRIGSKIASRSVLVSLTNRVSKMIIGITSSDLTKNKDAMNYKIVEKVVSDRVLSSLSDDSGEELATKLYLTLIKHVIRAYIDPDSTPLDRIYSSWFIVWSLRIWKISIDLNSEHAFDSRSDLYSPTIEQNFATRNVHVCVEINAHSLINYVAFCRNEQKPELFLPQLAGSQACEKTFGTFRTMSTSNYTAINFDMYDVMKKAKRILMINDIQDSHRDDFVFKRLEKKKLLSAFYELPTNEDIAEKVLEALNDVRTIFKRLSKIIFHEMHYNINFFCLTKILTSTEFQK
jgi:hypothetical protein